MAAVVSLVSSPKISWRFYHLFAAVRNGICASGSGRSWKRESSSYSEQESNQADMPQDSVIIANLNKSSFGLPMELIAWSGPCSCADTPVPMENPYKDPPKKCILCGVTVDYKNTQLLSQFISPYTGHIFGQHITGLCRKKQNEISKAIKRAHAMGFMSVMYKDPLFHSDPKICNIKYPE